jgi:hypothetical protein
LFTKVPIGDNFQAVETRLLGNWELPGGTLAQLEGKGISISIDPFDSTAKSHFRRTRHRPFLSSSMDLVQLGG